MIIKALMDLVYALFELFTKPIQIEAMPEGVSEILTSTFESIRFGLGLLANWTDLGYLLILFGIVLAVDGGMLIYKFVMWVLRKIPMLGIE